MDALTLLILLLGLDSAAAPADDPGRGQVPIGG
jgi:hypothetical protein